MSGLTLERLEELINRNFSMPFLEEGLVSAEMDEEGNLSIQIGRRDICIDKDGELLGCGTWIE